MEFRPILLTLMRNKTAPFLVAAQIAISFAILTNALHVVQLRQSTAARPSGILNEDATFSVSVRELSVGTPEQERAAHMQHAAVLRALPGVVSVAETNQLPMSRHGTSTQVYTRLGPNQEGATTSMYVTPDSLIKTWQLKLVEGRDFLPSEITEIDERRPYEFPRAVIVTQSLARRLWPDAQSVIGKTLYFGKSDPALWARVVGVVERLQSTGAPVGEDAEGSSISPIRLTGAPEVRYAVRSEPGQAARVMTDAEQAIRKSSPEPLIVTTKLTTEDRSERYRADLALSWMLLAVSALLTLVTASGIVGMASLWVTQRRKQIGVRRALGARKFDILRYFLLENVLITGAGVAVGIVLAIGLNQMLVYKLELPRLPAVFMWAGALVLLMLGLGSAFGPAWRATRVSPAEATRSV